MKEYNQHEKIIKGIFKSDTSIASQPTHGSRTSPKKGHLRRKLPRYWGIDLVCIPLMVAVTVYVVLHWDEILLKTAQIVSDLLVGVTIVLVFAAVIAIVLAIRNKKMW